MSDHETGQLIAVHKHELHRMLHIGVLKSAFGEVGRGNEKALEKTRFSDEQMQTLSKALRTLAKTEEKAQKHIEDVEATQNKKMCPYCGGELVKRQGKRGEFLGCKNFPKCRYTTSL